MSGQSVIEIGMCGKIPSRGDFLAQGLTAGFVDSWNEWLRAVMAVSREQLTSNWLDTYLTSPVWHFALSAGVCGDNTVIGCLMPSVDQVGRHFPFTLAAVTSSNPVQALHSGSWAAEFQQFALQTLDDDFDFVLWQQSLKQLAIDWPTSATRVEHKNAAQGRAAWAILAEEQPDALALLHHSYQQQFERYCLWWTQGSERIPPCTLVSSGLPQVSQYAAMLDGDWSRWQWQSAHIKHNGANA